MKKFKVGLQLYSVRNKMEEDMEKTLAAVKEAGYDYVEFAGFFGKTAEEVKALLDKYSLKCKSVHQAYSTVLDNPKETIEYLKTVGVEYFVIPWMGIENQKGNEGFDKAVEDIKKTAELLKENGIQLMYHNHDFEFQKYEDKFLLEWLFEAVGADNIHPQLDTCWVHYAGYNPSEYMKNYCGKLEVLHLKDFTCKNLAGGPVYALIDEKGNPMETGNKDSDGFEFRTLGSGLQDFEAILASAEEAGTEYVIVEQDDWYDNDSLELAKKSRDYLKTLGI